MLPSQQRVNWVYLNYAASVSDPVQRLKAFMASNIAFLLKGNTFEKPLNPVIGETYQARSPDGGMMYLEQTSHHPCVSHYLIDGPNNSYQLSAYFQSDVKTGMTSFSVNYPGKKTLKFPDG